MLNENVRRLNHVNYEVSGEFNIRGAVGGGADLVRDVDATFARERGCVAGIQTLSHIIGKVFQATARPLAVRGGLRRAAEGLHSVAAGLRRFSAASKITEARRHVAGDLPARDCGLCHGCSTHGHHNHAHHSNHTCNLEASHHYYSNEQRLSNVMCIFFAM